MRPNLTAAPPGLDTWGGKGVHLRADSGPGLASCPQQEGFNPPLTDHQIFVEPRPWGQALFKVLWDFTI